LLKEAIEIIKDFIDEEPCNYDHHGYCQSHNWLSDSECPHKRAKSFIAKEEEQ
jgi:hypothetical protein